MPAAETVPPLYERVWATQTNAAVGGMVSLGTLQKVLATGGVKASAVEKVRTSPPRETRLDQEDPAALQTHFPSLHLRSSAS